MHEIFDIIMQDSELLRCNQTRLLVTSPCQLRGIISNCRLTVNLCLVINPLDVLEILNLLRQFVDISYKRFTQ